MPGAHGFVEELYLSQQHEDRGTKQQVSQTRQRHSQL